MKMDGLDYSGTLCVFQINQIIQSKQNLSSMGRVSAVQLTVTVSNEVYLKYASGDVRAVRLMAICR